MPDTAGAKGSAEDANNAELIHTALCVEPRNGHLYVFLPPVTHLEHYLDLVHSIDQKQQLN